MITLTEQAAEHVKSAIATRGKGIGLRIGTKSSGCSGLAYRIEFCDVVADDDLVFENYGTKVIVSPSMIPYLDGTTVDYVQKGLNEGFEFKNPNVLSQCGCGTSFSV